MTSDLETAFALVLGSAQDAGVPQSSCACARCAAARDEPSLRRRPSCLGIVDSESGSGWLVDATPELGSQLAELQSAGGERLAGVFLTHAHVGHYLGLAQLGREVMDTAALPLHASSRMLGFLQSNEPWSQLFRLGQVEPRPLEVGRPVELAPGLTITPWSVPHRDEHSDTLAFVVEGTGRRLLWLPDIDAWDDWDRKLEEVLDEVDLAFLDGTFWSQEELPGREIGDIPHPCVKDTADRLAPGLLERRAEVCFVHLNHSNPLLGPDPALRESLERRGFLVAEESERFAL
jgi:pyrroloquinoline quinone biosynthesis protein B